MFHRKIIRSPLNPIVRGPLTLGGSATLPAKDSALVWLKGTTYDDGTNVSLVDKLGATTPPAGYDFRSQSHLYDGTAYLALTGILATDTVTNSGDSTLSTDTNKLEGTAGDAWDITITSSGGTDKYWISGADAVGTSIPVLDLVNGGTVYAVLTSGTLPDFFNTSNQDGVTGFNQSLLGFNIADSHATLTDGCIIPADPDNPSKDIEGTTLVYPGSIKLSAELTGYTGTWDTAAYAPLDERVTISGDFGIDVQVDECLNQYGYILGTNSSNRFRIENRLVSLRVAGVTYTILMQVNNGLFQIRRIGEVLYATDDTGYTGSVAISTADFPIDSIAHYGGTAAYNLSGSYPFIKLYNSSDTLIHHWVCESSPTIEDENGDEVDNEQGIIYDVAPEPYGGNHATLTSATLPFFTTESQEATYLLENGWELSSGNYIPAKAAGGESAAGNALTASPGDLRTVEPGFFEMPQDKALIAADPANEMFDGAGDSQALTYDDTDESPWLGDQLFGSDAKGRVVHSADLTGTDLTKADKYWETDR